MRKLFEVDYTIDDSVEDNPFTAELGFTLLDWIILDKIRGNKPFTISDVDHEGQLQLCFNIFPKGKTFLHKLAGKPEEEEGGAQSGD